MYTCMHTYMYMYRHRHRHRYYVYAYMQFLNPKLEAFPDQGRW